jgi:hypothetical protein
MNIEKSINTIISVALILCYFAVLLFIIANWKYISDPSQISDFPKSSLFAYKDHLVKFQDWGYSYPWKIICYLSLFQIIILMILITNKKINLNKWGLISQLTILTLLFFSSSFSETLYTFEGDFLLPASLCFSVYLSFSSIILLFMKQFKKHRKFFVLNLITSISCVLFLYGYILLFFD